MNGGTTYKNWPLTRRAVLKMALWNAPARGRWEFEESVYVAICFCFGSPIGSSVRFWGWTSVEMLTVVAPAKYRWAVYILVNVTSHRNCKARNLLAGFIIWVWIVVHVVLILFRQATKLEMRMWKTGYFEQVLWPFYQLLEKIYIQHWSDPCPSVPMS